MQKRTRGDLSDPPLTKKLPLVHPNQDQEPQRKTQCNTASEKKKVFKAKLYFGKEWQKKYPCVTCEVPADGMCMPEVGKSQQDPEVLGQPMEW